MKLSLESLIEDGGFSRVYVARVTASSSPSLPPGSCVAVKKMHITKHVKNSVLRHEACAYLMLAGHTSIPDVYAWGRSQYYDYLALELLGGDLFSVREGLTLRNFTALACAMLDALEHVHSRGLVHCDVKPDNFLFSRAPGHQLKLIDFGLAAPFRDLLTGMHIDQGTTTHLRGTPRYASIPAHRHITSGRRDDLESLAYTLVELSCGRLSWAGCNKTALQRKLKWNPAALPPVLAEFVEYTRALAFAAEPDYARWRTTFRSIVPGLPEGSLFDPKDDGPRVAQWAVLGTNHDESEDSTAELEDSTAEAFPHEIATSEDSDSIPWSNDGWVPTSTWPAPVSVRPRDLIGDEQTTVREQLQNIDEPPAMKEAYMRCIEHPEEMHDVPFAGRESVRSPQ